MEPLIFFLVVILIIVTNVVKAKKKLDTKKSAPAAPDAELHPEPQPQPKKKAATGWKRNVGDLLAQLREEMAQPEKDRQKPAEKPHRPSGWEGLVSTDQSAAQAPSGEDGPAHATRPSVPWQPPPPKQPQTLIESRSQQGQTPEARIGETRRRPPAPALDKVAKQPLSGCRRFRYNRGELRRAVIWYEVLGPPMSLRDPEREMWL